MLTFVFSFEKVCEWFAKNGEMSRGFLCCFPRFCCVSFQIENASGSFQDRSAHNRKLSFCVLLKFSPRLISSVFPEQIWKKPDEDSPIQNFGDIKPFNDQRNQNVNLKTPGRRNVPLSLSLSSTSFSSLVFPKPGKLTTLLLCILHHIRRYKPKVDSVDLFVRIHTYTRDLTLSSEPFWNTRIEHRKERMLRSKSNATCQSKSYEYSGQRFFIGSLFRRPD